MAQRREGGSDARGLEDGKGTAKIYQESFRTMLLLPIIALILYTGNSSQ